MLIGHRILRKKNTVKMAGGDIYMNRWSLIMTLDYYVPVLVCYPQHRRKLNTYKIIINCEII